MDNAEKLASLGKHKTKTNKTKTQHNYNLYVRYHYTQTSTINVNKTWTLLQTTGGKDELNIDFILKSYRISQHGSENITTHNVRHASCTYRSTYSFSKWVCQEGPCVAPVKEFL
jgi:hypothetical protein